MFENADLIHSYSRAQALADGELVDVTQHAKGYFKVPVAVTRSVWEIIDRAVKNEKHLNDLNGVLHDVFHMARLAMQQTKEDQTTVAFTVIIVGAGRKRNYRLFVNIGPGDKAEPVLTFMQPHEL